MNNQSLLGQLLLDLGWIGATDLENVVALSCQSGESIGRLLVEQGRITSRELQNLIEVQARVRDGRIHNAVGRHALDLSSWCGASLDQVLLWIGPGQADVDIDYSNRLGELLIGADCVERAIVEQSLCLSMQTGLQLGKILTIQKRVPENMVGLTLEAQKLIRAELLSREQALAGLRVSRLGLERQDLHKEMALPLGQLVMHAGLVSHKNVDDALEVSAINGQPLGQVLLIFALLSDRLLGAALELQKLMRSGALGQTAAIRALNLVFTSNCTVNEALSTVCNSSSRESAISVSAFLQLTGLFEGSLSEIRHIEFARSQSRDQLPLLSEIVDEVTLQTAVRCTFLIKHSFLTLDQALLAFHYSLLTDSDIDQFLHRAGWTTCTSLSTLSPKREMVKSQAIFSAA